jgi:hypothetical protein
MGTSVPVLEARSCAQDDKRKHGLRFTADTDNSRRVRRLAVGSRCTKPLAFHMQSGKGSCGIARA